MTLANLFYTWTKLSFTIYYNINKFFYNIYIINNIITSSQVFINRLFEQLYCFKLIYLLYYS